MNTTAEELDSRYIITKPGYKFGKLIRQPGGGFHCPHIGCDYTSIAQTGLGMHRKSKHGHIPLHSHKAKNPGARGGKVSREPRKITKPIPETRVEHIAPCKFCPHCGFHLEPVNISMSITGNGVRIL